MQRSSSAGGVILNLDGLVAIVNQDGRTWSLPKGRLEAGEGDLVAAYREIEEETGLKKSDLELVRELGSYERHPMDVDGSDIKSKLRHVTFFLFTTKKVRLEPQDPDNPEAEWLDMDKVAPRLTHPKDKAFFLSCPSQFRNDLKNI